MNNFEKGIGIDIVEVDRIREMIQSENGFREYVFSKSEIDYCEKNTKTKYEHYSGRFAAKEALTKALGIGIWGGISLCQISISNSENGQPIFEFSDVARKFLDQHSVKKIYLSISHVKSIAVAMVMIEKYGDE